LILELGAVQGNGRPDVKLMQEINLLLVDDPSPYKRTRRASRAAAPVAQRLGVAKDLRHGGRNPPPNNDLVPPPGVTACALRCALGICSLIGSAERLPGLGRWRCRLGQVPEAMQAARM
jgi:hypothetical protein